MAAVRTSAWRAAADPDDLREYDRFGPWLDRVRDERDMPRRFRPWYPELAGATFLVKVPRDFDRAQVRPGMDLYRSVFAVFPDRVVVLAADDPRVADVTRADLDLAAVVATRLYSNLLIGRWTLLLADGGHLDVAFNNVSEHEVTEIDRFVLRRPATDVHTTPLLPAVPVRDHYFRSRLTDIAVATDDAVHPVHVEEPRQPCRDEHGRRRLSTGVMLVETADSLVVVDRDEPTRTRFRWANYASNTTTIPFDRITSFRVVDPPAGPSGSFHRLVLQCQRQSIVEPCLARPDAVAASLRARGVRED